MHILFLPHRVRPACLLLAVSASLCFSASMDVTVKNVPAGAPRTLRLLERAGVSQAPIAPLAAVYGFAWSWDPAGERLVCRCGSDSVVFGQGLAACRLGQQTRPLSAAAERVGGQLYLPLSLLLELFNELGGQTLQWSAGDRTLSFGRLAPTLNSLACGQDSGATVVRMELSDSAGVEDAYLYPRLMLDVGGATLGRQVRRQARGSGVVDSLLTEQLGATAHVELLLRSPVDTPRVRTTRGGRSVTVTLKPRSRSAPVPDSLLAGGPGTIATVVIDAGHGGKDPGAVGPDGVLEKDITLKVALRLRDTLKEKTKLTVHLTRNKDEFLELWERTKFANDKKADVFVSLHANAVPGSDRRKQSVRGYKVYFLSQAKNEEDKLVAMQENAVVELEDKSKHADYLQGMLTQMVGTEYLRESQDLSIMLAESFAASLSGVRKQQTGVGQANFYVLNGAYMPSVLIELGFISNPAEEQLLGSEPFQRSAAQAIFDAVRSFKQKLEADL